MMATSSGDVCSTSRDVEPDGWKDSGSVMADVWRQVDEAETLLVAARFKEASNAADDILSRMYLARPSSCAEASSQTHHSLQESGISGKSGTHDAEQMEDHPQVNGNSVADEDETRSGDADERLQAVVAAGAVYVQAMHARKKHGRVAVALRRTFGSLSAVPPPVLLTWVALAISSHRISIAKSALEEVLASHPVSSSLATDASKCDSSNNTRGNLGIEWVRRSIDNTYHGRATADSAASHQGHGRVADHAAFLFDCARIYICQVLVHSSGGGGGRKGQQEEAGKALIGRLRGALSDVQLQALQSHLDTVTRPSHRRLINSAHAFEQGTGFHSSSMDNINSSRGNSDGHGGVSSSDGSAAGDGTAAGAVHPNKKNNHSTLIGNSNSHSSNQQAHRMEHTSTHLVSEYVAHNATAHALHSDASIAPEASSLSASQSHSNSGAPSEDLPSWLMALASWKLLGSSAASSAARLASRLRVTVLKALQGVDGAAVVGGVAIAAAVVAVWLLLSRRPARDALWRTLVQFGLTSRLAFRDLLSLMFSVNMSPLARPLPQPGR